MHDSDRPRTSRPAEVVAASRRSPETLPDEIILLESVSVLRSRLCGCKWRMPIIRGCHLLTQRSKKSKTSSVRQAIITIMKAEGVVKVSTKGQIVIPKDVRTQFGIVPGKKLLVAVEGNEILIKKMEELSLGELSKKLTKEARKERMDVDALVDEAIRWARK